MGDSKTKFQNQVLVIGKLYTEMAFIDIKAVKPEMIQLMNVLESDLDNRDYYARHFINMIESLTTNISIRQVEFVCNTLDYCMRTLKWDEIFISLKNIFPKIDDLSVKLKVELLIKCIYDKEWSGGDFELTEIPESIWDLA